MKRIEKLTVDFGEVNEDGSLTSLTSKAKLVVGQPVLLIDDDQNVCSGAVTSVADGMASIAPNWETWIPGDRIANPLPAQRSVLGINALTFTAYGVEVTGNVASTVDEPVNARLSFA
jgi:hypothetical protein